MKHLVVGAGLAALCAGNAIAGGVDRSGQPIAALFERGNYVEFSFSSVHPTVSGNAASPGFGTYSGDMANSYGTVGSAFKFALNDKFDVALIYDQPYGASIAYPTHATYFAAGATAELRSLAITAIGRYKFTDNISAYGGLRYQSFNAEAFVPFVAGYTGSTTTDRSPGFLLGAAYEKPEIALRVALTYFSKVTHDMTATETLGVTTMTPLTVETPQAVNLDFQTGVAPGTLVFGGVRWVNWSNFDISPAAYMGATGQALVSYDDDTFTYTLGVGRQLNENWAIAGTLVHEPATGGFRSNLNPPDGRSAIGVGVTYTQKGFKLQAGLQHIWLGDATTGVGSPPVPAGVFTDNTAIAFGMKMGFNF